MAFQGFGKNSGPSAPPREQTPFGHFPRLPSPTPQLPSSTFQPSSRFIESPPEWADGQKSFQNDNNAHIHQSPSVVVPFAAPHDSGASLPTKSRQVQDLKRSRSPPLLSIDDDPLRNSRNFGGRPVLLPPVWGNQSMLSGNFSGLPTRPDFLSGSPYAGTNDAWNNSTSKHTHSQMPKRTRSPPLPTSGVSQENSLFRQNNSKRPSVSPSRLDSRSNGSSVTPDSQSHPQSTPSGYINDVEAVAANVTNFPVPKRTRLPTLPSSDQIFGENYSVQDDTERELQAKAKRLVRFKDELSQPVQGSHTVGNEKVIGKGQNQSATDGRKLSGEVSVDPVGLFFGGIVSSDYEGLESSAVIIGMCPDMCPESERAERERKGDLDHYERLYGDRNQTNKFLAVKKYNRTAEREAELIRPMPILKNTIDYLLNLLDRPYDDAFLGLYNFLWDRMRAIRMDLRMQHIFNLDAIAMLEQMIRFHIIAMHELCEYTKGEGFSEGFDAHLNIEQMNKTSVELFQLYDDHRKKEIDVPTEKEFRGYYALLKLDKHPGYKVEPAELSLDLARMTREMRQTPEVLFPRDVARACRTGNFIAFFRLARKASYLQSCLMHAHFAKLRTQALASIHCGLQNNQGIPVALLAKWLGMQEEDIGELLEYHGFLIKEFEEPYMVKDGPFLNVENDYPVKCSKLVHLKKSERILDDVLSSRTDSLSSKEVKEIWFDELCGQESTPVQFSSTESSAHVVDEEIPDYEAALSPKDNMLLRPMLKASVVKQQNADDNQVAAASPLLWDSSFEVSSKSQQAKFRSTEKPNHDFLVKISLERLAHSNVNATPVQMTPRRLEQEPLPVPQIDYTENVVSSVKELKDVDLMDFQEEIDTDAVVTSDYDEEATEAKLKLILRIWRRRSSKKRELREQKQVAACAALSSLSLGPPIWQCKDRPSTFGELNIDHIMSARYEKHKRSWSPLNVSEVIASKLSERNPDARCLCWKIILCCQDNPNGDILGWTSGYLAASTWLFSKLMPAKDDNDDDLAISSPCLSIWKKWIPSYSNGGLTCCVSVIKDAKFDNLNETLGGASGVMFLVSECIPWELQKIRLHNLLTSLPSGSHIPLLILMATYRDNSYPSAIVTELGLHDIDKSQISTFSVVSLVKNQQIEQLDGFFSDEQLREGLQWLASECPLQPIIFRVKTRDLVMSHLISSMEFLDDMDACQVGPEYCISAFNDALDQSIREITAAAKANPSHWPCPEIALLEESSEEQIAVSGHLPSVGWSSAGRIEPLLSMLRECKLPSFPDDMSWLYRGSDMGGDVKTQRIQFEHCLIRYLTQSSELMGPLMATKEASVMLQKCTYFRLQDSTYYIVPNWVMIFQRIFNWRLMNLSNGDLFSTYVLEQHVAAISASEGPGKLWREGNISSHYLIRPSLDEMVEVGCSPVAFGTQHSGDEAFQRESEFLSDNRRIQMATSDSHSVGDARHLEQDGDLANRSDDNLTNVPNKNSGGLVVANKATMEADRLTKLLEQCNTVQNMIDKKLSIYF